MLFTQAKLKGAYSIELEKRADERGFFARAWCQKEFQAHNLISQFVRCNVSWNQSKGTLRGMHRQVAPYEESKLIRCTRGAVCGMMLDLLVWTSATSNVSGFSVDWPNARPDNRTITLRQRIARNISGPPSTDRFYIVARYSKGKT